MAWIYTIISTILLSPRAGYERMLRSMLFVARHFSDSVTRPRYRAIVHALILQLRYTRFPSITYNRRSEGIGCLDFWMQKSRSRLSRDFPFLGIFHHDNQNLLSCCFGLEISHRQRIRYVRKKKKGLDLRSCFETYWAFNSNRDGWLAGFGKLAYHTRIAFFLFQSSWVLARNIFNLLHLYYWSFRQHNGWITACRRVSIARGARKWVSLSISWRWHWRRRSRW